MNQFRWEWYFLTWGQLRARTGLLSAHLLTAPLLGPPHLRQRDPEQARFVGDASPAADPEAYAAAARSLAAWLRGAAAGAPLVVNTPGWVKARARVRGGPESKQPVEDACWVCLYTVHTAQQQALTASPALLCCLLAVVGFLLMGTEAPRR